MTLSCMFNYKLFCLTRSLYIAMLEGSLPGQAFKSQPKFQRKMRSGKRGMKTNICLIDRHMGFRVLKIEIG